MPKLTKRFVEVTEPNGRDYFVWDDELPGFGVRVFASGKRSYLIQYRAEGRTRRITIGLHGPLTCEEARKRARELLGKVAAGGNPADDRAEERKALTMRQLCKAYLSATEKGLILEKRGLPKKASTLATDRGRIERHILPLLANRKVRDLTTPDINRFLRDVASGKTTADIKTKKHGRAIVEGGKGTAARTVGLLGDILSYAVSEGVMPANPARGVKRPADQRRQVLLTPDQDRLPFWQRCRAPVPLCCRGGGWTSRFRDCRRRGSVFSIWRRRKLSVPPSGARPGAGHKPNERAVGFRPQALDPCEDCVPGRRPEV